jgi:tetratricopeptide (TPR) repeat protein
MESVEEGGSGVKKGAGLNLGMWVALVIGNCSMVIGLAHAQSVRSLVNSGNDLYASKKFDDAEVSYKKAVEKDITSVPGHFNLGNSLYRQDKHDQAVKAFENAISRAEGKLAKSQAYFNLGDAHLRSQNYDEAVKSFTESLKLNPDDVDAKYNLSYALMKQKEQQQQKNQNKNEKNQDKNKDQQQQNQDQNKQEQEKQDQQKQNQQNQQQQDQQQQQAQQDQTRQQQRQMSKADAERILDVLKNNEKDVQKKLRARVVQRPRGEKDW